MQRSGPPPCDCATLERLAAERPAVPYLRPAALRAMADADAPLADWEKYV